MEAVIQQKGSASTDAQVRSARHINANHDHLERSAIICCRGLLGRPRAPKIVELNNDRLGHYLATLGAQVTTVLPVDQIATQPDQHLSNHIIIQDEVLSQLRQLERATVDMVVFQRSLHLWPLAEARLLLVDIRRTLKLGARLYLSCAGVKSELAIGYPAGAQLADRHAKLDPVTAKEQGIHGRVTLYSTAEICTLVSEAGYDVESIWLSDEGHLNCCAVNRS